MTFYRRLILTALILTFGVVSLGAYVRLSDAGLGCPDWPGCYGKLSPLHAAEQIQAEWFARPHGPVSHAKAWKEMVHRYFAGTLGLLVLGIAMLAQWRRREIVAGRALPGMLLGLIVFQALLGMWTVTELLKPVVVTAHLLGGMATLAFLLWLWLRESDSPCPQAAPPAPLRAAAMLGLALVVAQIALGGWVSTNYAALACTDFPRCQGIWMPPTEFSGFTLHRPLGEMPSGELLSMTALTTIHWVHRVMALIVAVYLAGLVVWLVRERERGLAGAAVLVAALLLLQVTLGIANVLMSLPLLVAVAHNAGAAMLLASLVWLNFRLHRRNR
jgi:cytochrome c oxidase assembly protein subunit 15